MNKAQFADILNNPESVSEDTLSGLKEIIEEYPFFQIGRMLWLKNLHKLDHIKYNSELKVSAAYIPDRTKLFRLINNIGNPEPVANPVTNPIPVKDEETSTVSGNRKESMAEEEALPAPEAEEKQTSVTITDNYLNASDEFVDEEGSIYDFSLKSKEEEEKKENEIQDIVLPAADLLDYETTSSTSNYILPDIEEVENIDTDENRSFSDWLHVMHYSAPVKKEEREQKKKGMDLIDNFLNSNAQIVPDPTKKTKDVDLGKTSTASQEDILTETLAEIHIKQGHKNKAIAIFEKLRLKYPEKSVYFARRINELKEN